MNDSTTRKCKICNLDKPAQEFYDRDKRCKICIAALNKTKRETSLKRQRGDTHSGRTSEQNIINKLNALGIHSVAGSSTSFKLVDVVSWGCVTIEVKHSRLKDNLGGNEPNQFAFTFSPRQQKMGIKGDFVLLVCEYPEKITYHLIPSYREVFYKDGRLKAGLSYIPDELLKSCRHEDVRFKTKLSNKIMSEYQDAWYLIEEKRLEISERLKSGRLLLDWVA